jgi:hypothetical protein
MRKLCERAAYLASVVALLTVMTVGVSNKVGGLMNTARAQDVEIEDSGKKCPETSGPDCSYSGCYSNCDASGCHPSCAGQGRNCKDTACT